MARRQHRKVERGRVITCAVCGSQFCQVKDKRGAPPKSCSDPCRRSRVNEQRKEAILAWRARNPELVKEYCRRGHLKAKFGMTLEEYEAMLEEQGGVCAICEGPPDGKHAILNVDHCHTTGAVRALLCLGCNTGMGHFRDDPGRMRKAAAYLEAFSLARSA